MEGLGVKEGDLLEFELTLERNLRVTVMKSTTVTRKPKKMAPSELQATIAKKKAYRNLPMDQLSRSMMLTGQEGMLTDVLQLSAAAAQGMPIRLPDVSAAQVTVMYSSERLPRNSFICWFLHGNLVSGIDWSLSSMEDCCLSQECAHCCAQVIQVIHALCVMKLLGLFEIAVKV